MSKHTQDEIATYTTLSTGLAEEKDGYKQTKLGLIPEDWEVVELGSIGKVISGLTYSPNDVVKDGTLVLRSSNIQKGNLKFEDNVYVDTSSLKFREVQENDILICVRNGSKNLIGKNTSIPKSLEGVAFGAFMTIYRSALNTFLKHYFKTEFYQREIHKNLGATINSINGSNLKKFRVPLPPLLEQQKIASILNSWDKAIAAQEKLIAQKQALKKGLMQQLLTGKKRFPGFEKEWEEKSMDDIVKYLGGEAFESKSQVEKGVKWLKIANVGIGLIKWGNNTTFLPTGFIDKNPKYVLKEGDTVMALTRPILNDKLKIAVFTKKDGIALLNQRVAKLISKNKNDLKFIYYLHQTPHFIYSMNAIMAGTDPPNISLKNLSNTRITIPNYEEQKMIVSVIEGFDFAIDNLINIKQKLITQKQGLMQQLLTGKKRVII